MTYLTDGTITVSLHSTYDTRRNSELIIDRSRNIGGKSFDKLWSVYDQFDLPINYTTNSDACQINQWWENTNELTFFYDSTSYQVYIISEDQPFQQLVEPYHDEWTGIINLGVL